MSNQHTKSTQSKSTQKIDFESFQSTESKCNASQQDLNIVQNCTYLIRIVGALQYYQLLLRGRKDNSSGKAVFIEFMHEIYGHQCLNDYIHLICQHNDDLNAISAVLKEEYHLNVEQCQQKFGCVYSVHHYSRRDDKSEYNFYIDLFNTIHFCIFHLEIMGLRSQLNSTVDMNDAPLNLDLNCIDSQFSTLQKEIAMKRNHIHLNSDRINPDKNTKFNISVEEQFNDTIINASTGKTFMDSIHACIQSADNNDARVQVVKAVLTQQIQVEKTLIKKQKNKKKKT
eukprot:508891_1